MPTQELLGALGGLVGARLRVPPVLHALEGRELHEEGCAEESRATPGPGLCIIEGWKERCSRSLWCACWGGGPEVLRMYLGVVGRGISAGSVIGAGACAEVEVMCRSSRAGVGIVSVRGRRLQYHYH